jgi:predicted DNA-binding transcriptional regulator AlpA
MLVDRAGLRNYFGITQVNSTLLEWEKKGLFPRRIKIGRTCYWSKSSVEEHLASLQEGTGR